MNTSCYKCPESVLVVVYTPAGEVLLLERREPAGYWQSVTGSLEHDESPREAAVRELHEETGLELPVTDCRQDNTFPIHPAWQARYAPETTHNREYVFRARCETPQPVHLNAAEHRAYRWVARASAAQLASSATNRAAILDYVPDRAQPVAGHP
jgi:dATP pyrophosphohydrolase